MRTEYTSSRTILVLLFALLLLPRCNQERNYTEVNLNDFEARATVGLCGGLSTCDTVCQ